MDSPLQSNVLGSSHIDPMHWMDILEYPKLVQQLADLDRQLDRLHERCSASPDPDGMGLFDDVEAAVGDGFFRCQLYMGQRKGHRRRAQNAYHCGPRHRSRYVAEVVNAAANYFKHSREWPFDEADLTPQQRRTLCIIRDAGSTQRDYRLANLLYEFHPNRPRLSMLLPQIIAWREAVDLSDDRAYLPQP
jgi:hypothetical protein